MARLLIALGVIAVSIITGVSTFVHRSVDWVDRLSSGDTHSIVATTTMPIEPVPPAPSVAKTLVQEEHTTVSSSTELHQKPPLATTTPKVKPAPVKKVAREPRVIPGTTTEALPPTTSGPVGTGVMNEKMIIDLTNVERVREGKSPLVWNQKLAQMAYTKAKDMLDRQYFAHESPTGKNVAGLAEDVAYVYRLVGENLAVGNFRSNEELLAGWMGSPGHKENILKTEYTEMGAAAIEGVFEGDRVWMAVQEFGKPFPKCDKPSVPMKDAITALNQALQSLDTSVVAARNAIESAVDEELRSAKIAEYNTLVDTYNSKVNDIKALINEYNTSVRAYNTCVEAP